MLNDAVAIVLFQTLQKSAGSPLSWATLPFLGANFAFIGFGSMAIGALRQELSFGIEHGVCAGRRGPGTSILCLCDLCGPAA